MERYCMTIYEDGYSTSVRYIHAKDMIVAGVRAHLAAKAFHRSRPNHKHFYTLERVFD